MAAYDLEEQEQLDEIKAWWKTYGNLVINLITAIAIAFASWQGWNWYQKNQAAEASAVFYALQNAVAEKDIPRIKLIGGEILEKHSRTSYAGLAALTTAKAMLDAEDLQTAKIQLTWAAANASDEIRDLAKLRLATILLDEKEFDAALAQLARSDTPAFEARFADTRGDILLTQDKKADALREFELAKTKLDSSNVQPNNIYRQLLEQKINSLAGAK